MISSTIFYICTFCHHVTVEIKFIKHKIYLSSIKKNKNSMYNNYCNFVITVG